MTDLTTNRHPESLLREGEREMRRNIKVTQDQLADAFTEWDRRYRTEPERFQSEVQHLLKETPHTYGQACAPYLISILKEQATP